MSVRSTQLHAEIHEQPAVIDALLHSEEAAASALAEAVRTRGITHVVIAARGTSDNAARYAQYVLGMINRLPVALAAPSQFTLYHQPPRFGNALVLGISQSGQSPDIIAVLAEARQQGALTAVITNTPDSSLAGEGDFVIPLHAGDERAVAATKSYTASLAAIALFAAALADDASLLSQLRMVPEAMQHTLAVEDRVAVLAPRYRYMTRSVVTGRGYNYATAFELALKLKELTYTIVEPYSSADFLHGPLAMIEHDFPVIVVAPSGVLLEEMRTFVGTLKAHQAEVLCISDDESICKLATLSIGIPGYLPEWLSPLTTIIPGQLLSLHLAHERGHNVDRPRSIRKVTETT